MLLLHHPEMMASQRAVGAFGEGGRGTDPHPPQFLTDQLGIIHKLRWLLLIFFDNLTPFVDSYYLIKVDIFGLPTHLFL